MRDRRGAVVAVVLAVAVLSLVLFEVLTREDSTPKEFVAVGRTTTELDQPAGESLPVTQFRGTALPDGWAPRDLGPADEVTVSDGALHLTVAGDSEREAWGTLTRPRIEHAMADEDFIVDVGLGTVPSEPGQAIGITFDQDPNNWVGFDLVNDGMTRITATRTIAGESRLRLSAPLITEEQNVVVRIERRGSIWSLAWGAHGDTFVDIGSLESSIDVATLAVGGGAFRVSPGGTMPQVDVTVESIRNGASPVDDAEDDPDITVTVVGRGTYEFSPPLAQLVNGDTVTIVALPDEGARVLDWQGDGVADGDSFTATASDGLEVTLSFEDVVTDPIIDIWYGDDQRFGSFGTPQRWANILGDVQDRDGIASLSYSLNDGEPVELTIGPDGRRLAEQGDFNAEIAIDDLTIGPNTVVFRATDTLGNTAEEVVNVTRVNGDGSLRAQTIRWADVTDLQDVIQIVDGRWSVDDGALVITDPDYDRAFVLGDRSWVDYEIEVHVTPLALDTNHLYQATSGNPALYLLSGWLGHVDWTGLTPRTGYWPSGAFAIAVWPPEGRLELAGNERDAVETLPLPELVFGTEYVFKLRAESVDQGVQYSFKLYSSAEPEPDGWDLEIIDQTGNATGSVLVAAHHVKAAFGEIVVTPL